jgi:hypothetical protein
MVDVLSALALLFMIEAIPKSVAKIIIAVPANFAKILCAAESIVFFIDFYDFNILKNYLFFKNAFYTIDFIFQLKRGIF